MSGLLAGKVWQSALAPHLKPLAAALADIANDDGTSIRPSVAYAAWLLGRSERSIQDGLAELRTSRVLRVVAFPEGGRGMATEYALDEERLPKRLSWRELRKGATVASFSEKGATDDTKGCNEQQERVKQAAPQPSGDPSIDPSSLSTARTRAVSEADLIALAKKFPGCDIPREWEKAKDWLKANGKSKKDNLAFLRNWLRRAEDDRRIPAQRTAAAQRGAAQSAPRSRAAEARQLLGV